MRTNGHVFLLVVFLLLFCCRCIANNYVLYFQLSEWNKNDEKLLKAIEIGDVDKVQSLLQKKTLVPTKLGPRGLSV